MIQHKHAVLSEEQDLSAEGAPFPNVVSDPLMYREQAPERREQPTATLVSLQPKVPGEAFGASGLGEAVLIDPSLGGRGQRAGAATMDVQDDTVNWYELVQSLEAEEDGGRANPASGHDDDSSLKSTSSLEESFRSAF